MNDNYASNSKISTAKLDWKQIENIDFAKKLEYTQINMLILNIQYRHWYCLKKRARKSGVNAID